MARIALVSLATTLLIVASHAFTTLKVDDKPLQFTYSGAKGPDRWATLNSSFALCAKGKSQSPIDIVTSRAVPNKNLKLDISQYHAVNASLVNYKFTVALQYPDHFGWIRVDDKQYGFKQMHWHSPSEHRINGKRYAAEIHMVHIADDGAIAVLANLYEHGHPDPLLQTIRSQLNQLASNVAKSQESSPIDIRIFHPEEIRKTPSKYYKYVGSFSAPPCTENIIYLVDANVRSISKDQVDSLKAPLDMRCKFNARPCQPINRRQVEVFG